MFAKLLVIAGPDRGKWFEVVPALTLVLGRSREADARLTDPRAASVHCKITVRNRQIYVTDMDSLTGTSVNNIFVTTEYPLQPGDTFTLGDTVVLVQDPEAPDPPGFAAAAKARREGKAPAEPAPKASAEPAPKARREPRPSASPKPPSQPVAVAVPLSEPEPALANAPAALPERIEQLTDHTLAHFRVGPLLTRSRTGFVFKAHDLKANRPVALKVLSPAFTREERNLKRFTRAMKLAMPLRHPNIVPVLGAGKTGPYAWMAMELVQGESLTGALRHIGVAGSFDWRRALRASIYLGRGLNYLHEQKMVYRNLGPQNILCAGEAKLPRLSDFVRLRPCFDPVEPGAEEELPETLMHYAAPEQTREELEIDSRSDIFNLGALCYMLLTGRPPFEGGSLAETITKIRRERPENPKKFQLAIPEAFEGVVLQMLAKRPEDRYQGMAEVLRDLERVLKYQGMTL